LLLARTAPAAREHEILITRRLVTASQPSGVPRTLRPRTASCSALQRCYMQCGMSAKLAVTLTRSSVAVPTDSVSAPAVQSLSRMLNTLRAARQVVTRA
jgi:hypothetical protein